MLIYFSGPLFSEAEKRFNLRLTERLEEAGFPCSCPSATVWSATSRPMTA
jgi:nucleoside 2-deoxyribosyltransferase